MKLALDFDGVLSHTMKSFVRRYNEIYNGKLTIADIQTWNFFPNIGLTTDEGFAIFDYIWDDWTTLEPLEQDLKWKTRELSQLGELDIVTAVTPGHTESLLNWLNRHEIHYNKVVQNHEKHKLDYDIYIDDGPHNAKSLESVKKKCFLYHQPWNRGLNGNYITRVYNLNHVIEILRGAEIIG